MIHGTYRVYLIHSWSVLLALVKARNAWREELKCFEDIVVTLLYEVRCKYCEEDWSSDTAEI